MVSQYNREAIFLKCYLQITLMDFLVFLVVGIAYIKYEISNFEEL